MDNRSRKSEDVMSDSRKNSSNLGETLQNRNEKESTEDFFGFSNASILHSNHLMQNMMKSNDDKGTSSKNKPNSTITSSSKGTKKSSLSPSQILCLQLEHQKRLANIELQEKQLKYKRDLEERRLKFERELEEARLRKEKEFLDLELQIQLSKGNSTINEFVENKGRLKEFSEGRNNIFEKEEQGSLQKVKNWLETNKNDLKTESCNSSHRDVVYSSKNDLEMETFCQDDRLEKILLRQTIDKELPIFSGNGKEWPSFYSNYTYTTKALGLSDEENICRLRKSLKGDALRSVQGLLISMSVPATDIIDILRNKYGRPDIIVRNMVSEAKNLPIVKNNDFVALTQFSETVSNLVLTFESLSMENYLSCPQLMDDLMQKLPFGMQLSWGEKVANNKGKYSLRDFKKWVNEKANAASYVQSMSSQRQINPNFKRTLVVAGNKQENKCLLCKENHNLDMCKRFIEKSIEDKWKIVKENKVCFCCLKSYHRISNCRNKRKCAIDDCQKIHHKLLHFKTNKTEPRARADARNLQNENIFETGNHIVGHTLQNYRKEVLLKIVPVILRTETTEIEIYALLDDGATVSLIDESLANELNLVGEETILRLKWTDQHTTKQSRSRKVSFSISNIDRDEFYPMENIYTSKDLDLPIQNVDSRRIKSNWKHLEHINFPNIESIKPKLLIGQDYWELITTRELIEGPKNSPALSRTKLGWIVHGNVAQFKGRLDHYVNFLVRDDEAHSEDLHDMVKHFFTIESLGVKYQDTKSIKEDEEAENLIKNISRRKNGRWETGLLWKDTEETLPDSKNVALQRFRFIERKMSLDQDFGQAYSQKIKEYKEKGYIRKLSMEEEEESHKKIWYLPHFGVVNPNKPGKIRLVMDAASKVDGKCLNDFLYKGPDLLNSLISVIAKFREKPIAFSADIREMFHMIEINDEDQHAQRIIWRDSPANDFETYVVQVMIFGAVSSPYSAQYIKNINALEYEKVYPEAVDAIINRHYMDDYIDSSESPEKASKLINEVIAIHKMGGFELRGWISNSEEVFQNIPEELRTAEKIFEDSAPQRVLGLRWLPKEDVLSFCISLHKVDQNILDGKKIPTKREMLSVIMSLFDPLGILGNYIVKAKILMQDIWKSGIKWDDQISDAQNKKWKLWLNGLEKIKSFTVQRCYVSNYFQVKNIQLHLFCDASKQAFAAVAYFRFEAGEKIEISLVMSRNQVCPLKTLTIPRLELQAAVLASRLAKTIQHQHTLKINRIVFWSDSTTVLNWLRTDSKKLPSFVSNRVGEILENTDVSQWKWVPSKLNIADEATRDDKEADLRSGSPWLKGPEFLYQPPCFWPEENIEHHSSKNYIEESQILLLSHAEENNKNSYLPDISKFSSLRKLLNSTAYVFRFIRQVQKKPHLSDKEKYLTCSEIQNAKKLWCLQSQKDSFCQEYRTLVKGKSVNKDSKLFPLSPCLNDNLICLKGRIDNCPELKMETKRPIILSHSHPFTRLLVREYHERNGHAGTQLVLNEIRQEYWITQARKLIASVINSCNFCKIKKAKPIMPEMGQLPLERLQQPPRAFFFVGIDYFGPIDVVIGRRHEKRYGVLFTCLSVRAVHLELAESLNTDSAILAIRRFIARRGQPVCIWSDNGTNLCSADRELRKALNEVDDDEIKKNCLAQNIDWKFIAPASPHMGGAWERMVRTVKQTLKIILRERIPKLEVLQTVLIEAENIVNSRPLTYVSSNENDFESITPNHFLIGTSSIVKPPGIFEQKFDLRKQWRFAQQLVDRFWHRWVREYLPTLTARSKWLQETRNIEVGEVVVLMDNQLPRNNWPLGRITAVYPGKDQKVRVVDIKTNTGTYRRSVSKICPIGLIEGENVL